MDIVKNETPLDVLSRAAWMLERHSVSYGKDSGWFYFNPVAASISRVLLLLLLLYKSQIEATLKASTMREHCRT